MLGQYCPDCFSRTDIEAVTKVVDFHSLSEAQKTDSELHEFRNRTIPLQLKDIPLHTIPGLITCDVSTGMPRPFVPKAFRRRGSKTIIRHISTCLLLTLKRSSILLKS
ncbi:unnamed protein product [Hymenolepis diminuta]|uniref:Uncharacterized protein n=1 Tax=Hymenolepis diminuta TaxID=6216 RepID=A0A564Y868_HYMDI|nr:unnamed protein product [Hymenolepis diminuta]